MGQVLILTDDPESGKQLARRLGGSAAVHDLYDDAPLSREARLLIGDIRLPHSGSIIRLKQALAVARQGTTPFLYLIHGNHERGEIQATMLGATRSMPATIANSILITAVAQLQFGGPTTARPDPIAQVRAAREAFAAIFNGKTPALDTVEQGTAAISHAINDMRVSDWLALVEQFDDITHRHCLAVAGLTAAFAKALGLNARDSHLLTKGSLLHDIGKSLIPLEILNKPAPLDLDERREMNRHPILGYEMLTGGEFSDMTLKVVRSHHEMLDGSGYPDGLVANQIPDMVRLVTICDIYAALLERRPYKLPKCPNEAYRILTTMEGKLDQDLVRAFGPVALACGTESQVLSA